MKRKATKVVPINNGRYWTGKGTDDQWHWYCNLRSSRAIYESSRGYKLEYRAAMAAESYGLTRGEAPKSVLVAG